MVEKENQSPHFNPTLGLTTKKTLNLHSMCSYESNTCTYDLFRFPTLFIRMLIYNIKQKLKTEKCFMKLEKITLKTTLSSVLLDN